MCINLIQLAVTGLLFILMLVQLVFAVVRTINRINRKAPVKGWLVYWLMIVLLIVSIYTGMFATDKAFTALLTCVSIPAIWFFFVGRASDNTKPRLKYKFKSL
jgi:hypothetical protein